MLCIYRGGNAYGDDLRLSCNVRKETAALRGQLGPGGRHSFRLFSFSCIAAQIECLTFQFGGRVVYLDYDGACFELRNGLSNVFDWS